MTTTTTSVCALATACDPRTFSPVITSMISTANGLDPVAVVGDRGARVAAERHRDHGRDDRVDGEEHPRDDAGDVSVPHPRTTYSRNPPADG